MIKAKSITAIAIPLTGGGDVVLVPDGPEWNNLQKFKCVSPPALSGQTIIAARDLGESPLGPLFGSIFKVDQGQKWVAVMAAPELACQLKQEEE